MLAGTQIQPCKSVSFGDIINVGRSIAYMSSIWGYGLADLIREYCCCGGGRHFGKCVYYSTSKNNDDSLVLPNLKLPVRSP